MELFETQETFKTDGIFLKIQEILLKTDGIFKNRWNPFLSKKTMELFHRFHRFLMDKKRPVSKVPSVLKFLGFQKVPSVLNLLGFQKVPSVKKIITLCRMFLPPEAKTNVLLDVFLFLYYGKRCIWNGFVGLKPQNVS